MLLFPGEDAGRMIALKVCAQGAVFGSLRDTTDQVRLALQSCTLA